MNLGEVWGTNTEQILYDSPENAESLWLRGRGWHLALGLEWPTRLAYEDAYLMASLQPSAPLILSTHTRRFANLSAPAKEYGFRLRTVGKGRMGVWAPIGYPVHPFGDWDVHELAKKSIFGYTERGDTILDLSVGKGAVLEGALRSERRYMGVESNAINATRALARMAKVTGETPALIEGIR